MLTICIFTFGYLVNCSSEIVKIQDDIDNLKWTSQDLANAIAANEKKIKSCSQDQVLYKASGNVDQLEKARKEMSRLMQRENKWKAKRTKCESDIARKQKELSRRKQEKTMRNIFFLIALIVLIVNRLRHRLHG